MDFSQCARRNPQVIAHWHVKNTPESISPEKIENRTGRKSTADQASQQWSISSPSGEESPNLRACLPSIPSTHVMDIYWQYYLTYMHRKPRGQIKAKWGEECRVGTWNPYHSIQIWRSLRQWDRIQGQWGCWAPPILDRTKNMTQKQQTWTVQFHNGCIK